jgi:PEP-CTERM/exosortase A-associated glycosyltransferase
MPIPEDEVEGWRFHRTPMPRSLADQVPLARELRLMRFTASRLAEVARAVRPDVIHAHSPVLNAIPALRVGRTLRIPVVYEIRAFWEDAAVDHGTTQEGSLRYRMTRALETWAARRADAVTVICEGLRNDLVQRGIAERHVTVIPNAVDVEKFLTGREPDVALRRSLGLEGCRVLGFIGSFYAYEGLDLLLRALPRIVASCPDVKVLLTGGGAETARLQELARAPALRDRVIFTGRVPHEEVDRYYDLVDVLVYPRYSMRLTDLVTPLKPLEAMAQGRLVVGSDVGGHRELVRDGQNGVLFRAGDPDDLARKVVELLNARESWPGLRARARAYVEAERNWRASVARYAPVYASLTGSAGELRVA